MRRCHRCGKDWESEKKQPAVKEMCPHCSAYLHCCLNCRFHEPHAHNQCHIPGTEWVGDRAGCNFCDEFEFADTGLDTRDGQKKKSARDAFSGLFGEDDKKTGEGRDAFDKLFGD